jgi:hypothetical protein
MKTPPRNATTKLKPDSNDRRGASPRRHGERAADVRDLVRLSARNPDLIHATGAVHFLKVIHPLQGGMAKQTKAADQAAAVACILRVVTKDGRTVLEIEIPDEKAALSLAAKLVRGR